MFLSREIDIKLCQIYTKIHNICIYMQFCIKIAEYELFKHTTFISNCIYMNFRINLTQFYINSSREEHQIEHLKVS